MTRRKIDAPRKPTNAEAEKLTQCATCWFEAHVILRRQSWLEAERRRLLKEARRT